MKTVLISGGSIAGPALAYWLRRRGFAPTVVERNPAPRLGGQAIDIRGAALDVIDRMGLGDQVRAARTRMRGMTVLDRDGNELDRTTERTFTGGRFDSTDVELMREDLSRIVVGATRDDVEYIYGDSIATLDEDEEGDRNGDGDGDGDGHGVRVTFERGAPRTFDYVVGADGLHSTVRALAFGPEQPLLHRLDGQIAIFSAENFLDLENWQIFVTDEEALFALIAYPVPDNSELRITLGFNADLTDYDHRDTEAHKALAADRLSTLGWESRRLLKYLAASTDFYFDTMAQVRMEHWSKGRVTLVGDAGYCPSPATGQGTSLALVGAYVLADSLAAADGDHRVAYARTEDRMRPFIRLNQSLVGRDPVDPATEAARDHAKSAISLDG
ncbi:FAD-dependent monooxygenase [Streptomyces sp. NPDC050610]|uniref:FAD-dependent monooxygenase n=1 Tax=Streptomyces sp. NPDC050610 TaxID=3157097 RepID=UPI003433F724